MRAIPMQLDRKLGTQSIYRTSIIYIERNDGLKVWINVHWRLV